jgi:PAS domain S-box-containing protein
VLNSSDLLNAAILIVDDKVANIALLEQMLRGAGYVAITSTRDSRAVGELHRQHCYDLILLDLQMPGLDGFQVMEELKKIETGGYLPVLVVTVQPDHKLRALKAGAKDFVSKPFDVTEVLIRVHNLLEVRLLHRNEAALSRARLDNSQRLAGLGDWDYNFADHRLLWSEEVYRILGLERKDFPPDSATFYRHVHPDDLAFVHREKKAAADGSNRVDFEHRIIRADGEVRHIHQITGMVFDDQGRPVRESGTIQDITERKRAEAALQREQALLSSLISTIPDHIYVKDRQGRFLRVNDSMAQRIGLHGPDEAIGKTDVDFFTAEHAQPVLQQERRIMETGESVISLEEKETWADGLVTWASTTKVALRNPEGEIVGLVGVSRDITERKAAETALRESEERFKLVAHAVSDVVWDWDIAANTLWWNDGFLTTFGFTAGEVAPSIESWTGRIHPDDRKRVVASRHHAIDGSAESWNADYRVQRKDGTHAFVQDRGFILRDPAGKSIRMVGGMRDLTEQKKMEAQFMRAQRMESIGTLAGGIAHDLNNVLAPIMMAIELLQIDSRQDSRRTMILDTIHSSCSRGADLVRQVLSFGRGMDGQRVAIRLRHLIGDLRDMISETFPRNIRIVETVSDDLWPITGDPTQLHQVLLNLAVNARDAMPHGGTLSLTARNLAIDAQYASTSQETKAGTYVLLQVTDTGEGIPPEIRERIFEPFFTTKEIGKGTGLGLAIVHTIIKSHGGFLKVESEVGRGTKFSVYLPADPAYRTDATVPPFVVALPRGRDELVLVVDDEFSIRHITQQTLEAFGYRVIIASDGAEAVALYAKQAQQIALVVTDMMMPIMDGAALAQVLRRINPLVRIIAASGIDSSENVTKASNAGVKHFLLKPYTAETLLKLVREMLDSPAFPVARGG